MTDSLNAGSELDNEDLFGQNIEPGEIPDFEGEIKLVVAYEHRIEDLERLADSIERANGMNQRFAMEAEAIVPGMLVTERIPLGYYSKDTSATRLKVSLEEISKGIWALIAAGIVAALAVLVKLISWFRGRGSDENASSGEGRAAAHEDASDTAGEIQRVMETVGREKTEDGDSLQNVAKDLQVRRDTEIYLFLREQNEAVSEILAQKNLHHSLMNLCKQLPRLTAAFAQKYNLVTKMIIEDIEGIATVGHGNQYDKSTEVVTPIEKRQVMTPIPIQPLGPHIRGSLADITRIFLEDFKVKASQPHKIGDNYDTVLRDLAKAMNNEGIVTALKERADWEAELKGFEKDLKDYNTRFAAKDDGESGDNLSVELGKHIREAIAACLQDATNLTRLHGAVAEASRMMVDLVKGAAGVTESLVRELESRATNGGYPVPEEVKKLKERLKELKKK